MRPRIQWLSPEQECEATALLAGLLHEAVRRDESGVFDGVSRGVCPGVFSGATSVAGRLEKPHGSK